MSKTASTRRGQLKHEIRRICVNRLFWNGGFPTFIQFLNEIYNLPRGNEYERIKISIN